ncbi:nitrate/nitrite transporter NrtS [Alterisphingorhabdus coralli]|uniref:Nitrate/nitrite transporter NrtS n=1 Tax=Alterisphingorhabdus coralli TaxID=3071408 RepID=A0AA97F7H5_9SPHN|nr:nitrate/nitrite transporter NrtS [Parasphingorhabdus sp. SCSIO 66989]WOE75346.1 nitrate/nitrite transporter NrtS [Parasphingorhabdus sp. SCSIO 66989]
MTVPQDTSFWGALLLPVTIRRAIKVSMIVGTLLVLLNHGDAILIGDWPYWWKIVLTYAVPYSVSSYSTAAFIVEIQNAPPGRSSLESTS